MTILSESRMDHIKPAPFRLPCEPTMEQLHRIMSGVCIEPGCHRWTPWESLRCRDHAGVIAT